MSDLVLSPTNEDNPIPVPVAKIPPANGPVKRAYFHTPGSKVSGQFRRVLVIIAGAYLSTAQTFYLNLGGGLTIPIYLTNAAPGLSTTILIHQDTDFPIEISEITIPMNIVLSAGVIGVLLVEF